MTARLLAAAALLLLAGAAPATAGVRTFGSDLSRPANAMEAHGTDTVFWPRRLASGGSVRVPATGKIRAVRIRGFADSTSTWRFEDGPPFRGGERLFHIQVLRPRGGRRFEVRANGTSGHLYLPGPRQGAGPDTVTRFPLVNLCARRGDRVALNTVGGFNAERFPSGTPLHIFADVPGTETYFYEGQSTRMSGRRRVGRELLMRVELATGRDAGICRR